MNTSKPEYKALGKFAGKWNTEGTIRADGNNPEVKINGTDTYEWLPGGFFLIHKVAVFMGDEKNDTIEIIGFDPSSNSYTMQYYDHKGNSGTMKATLNNDTWTFIGDKLRFSGRFSQDEKIFSGIWEKLTDDETWVDFIDIKLVKNS